MTSAIVRARSPFEQYQALQAARNLAPTLTQDQRRRLRETVQSALDGQASPVPVAGSDRESVARDLVARLR